LADKEIPDKEKSKISELLSELPHPNDVRLPRWANDVRLPKWAKKHQKKLNRFKKKYRRCAALI
jgi:hypothetical protein